MGTMTDDSIIGRYARVVVERGTGPLNDGLKLACRITGVTTPEPRETNSALRGEVVSNDVDGPLEPSLLEGFLVITPIGSDLSEAKILQRGAFRAKVNLLDIHGEVVARAEGELIRISDEIPFESACPDCQGWKICEDCGGTGGSSEAVCPYCRGSGQCTRCKGTGFVTESEPRP